jgi:hypothetical protein
MRSPSAAVAAAIFVGAFPQISFAADLVVKAQPTAAVSSANGFYFWLDGSHQSIHLPTYNLGFKALSPGTVVAVPSDVYDPRGTGWGIRGALGYVLPHGTLPPAFGSDARVELGGSYVKASATQSTASPDGENFSLAGVAGVSVFSAICFVVCHTSSALASDYAAWQANAKLASDFRLGVVTLTPSLSVFGGNTHNDQTLAQRLTNTAGFAANYAAQSSLHWRDWGAKVGLDAKTSVTSWMTIGLGGSVGVVSRSTSLSANDSFTTTSFGGLDRAEAAVANANTTPFLANLEGNVTVTPYRSVAIKAFAGLNYDSRVPGITAPVYLPAFANGVFSPGNVVASPVGINFSSETSWYAGGGVVVKFGG